MSSKLPGLRSLAPCPKQLAVYSDPAQDAPDPGQEFPRIEGFGEVVVGANLQPDNPLDGFSGSGEHDDRNATAIPKLARQNEPILPGIFRSRMTRSTARTPAMASRAARAAWTLSAVLISNSCLPRYS
jgi:hypothetical protein